MNNIQVIALNNISSIIVSFFQNKICMADEFTNNSEIDILRDEVCVYVKGAG